MIKFFAFLVALFLCTMLLQPQTSFADQVAVHYSEGLLHGFLVLRTLEGKTLAVGDLTQTAQGDRVTAKLVLRFKDGSIHEETTVFSQRDKFQVLQYHLIQKGPAFPHSLETSIDVASGQVAVHYTEEDGQEKDVNEKMELAPDLANGIVPTLLKNILASESQVTVSMVANTPKPRLIKLAIAREGEEPFLVGGSTRKATHYVAKVELGAVAGVVAPLIGKQPPDFHFWISSGEAPTFLRSEGPLFSGGPIWRIEQTCPALPRSSTANSHKQK